MDLPASDEAAATSGRGDGRPRLVGRVGSLDAFWPLMEPILVGLHPRRWCEIGVDQAIFTRRLLAWGQAHGCEYVGIDPAPDPAAADMVTPPARLILGRSLDVLPDLQPCEAYFIDGDHNYHTVRHELELIARAAPATGPVVFVHDVGWPWARRDMYHAPDAIPPQARHPSSVDLGVSLDGDALVPDGLRLSGRYAIAQQSGGEGNGVLTAVEDFLSDQIGEGWRALIVPMAFGLAVLYRPEAVPESCRMALDRLATACQTVGGFLESCEANFLSLYLYAETAKSQVAYWTGDGQPGQDAHGKLSAAYEGLSSAYRELSTHGEKLMQDYHKLLDAYHELDRAFRRVTGK